MIFKCGKCQVVHTRVQTRALVNTTKLPVRVCTDCDGFDWPKTTAGQEYAKSLKLGS